MDAKGSFVAALKSVFRSIAGARRRLLTSARNVEALLMNGASTIVTVSVMLAALVHGPVREFVNGLMVPESVLAQLASTIGTMWALVLSLSIIPIQRAGEVWSPALLRLYRRDRATQIIFLGLGAICIVAFLIAVKSSAAIPGYALTSVGIALLAISLDTLRWYYTHVTRLLDPAYAMKTATNWARKAIDNFKQTVRRGSDLIVERSGDAASELSRADIECALYQRLENHPAAINLWSDEIAEIAEKAISRGDKAVVGVAIRALLQIAHDYLDSRRENLSVGPSPDMFLVPESDVKVVLNHTYERMQEIAKTAIEASTESNALKVTEGFGDLATIAVSMRSDRIPQNSAPLAFSPISYLSRTIKLAQSRKMQEIPFQGSETLMKISLATPKNISLTDVHIPVMDAVADITTGFLAEREAGLSSAVSGRLTAVGLHLANNNDFYLREGIAHLLSQLEGLIALAVLLEKLQPAAGTLGSPVSGALGLTSRTSLAYIFETVALRSVEVDPAQERVNPYRVLIEITDALADPLRRIAERNDFGKSWVLWELTQVIKHLGKIVTGIAKNPIRPGHNDVDELLDEFEWVLSFTWAAFHEKAEVAKLRAGDMCDALASIGLRMIDAGVPDRAISCAKHIRSIAVAYSKANRGQSEYYVADLLIDIRLMQTLLEAREHVELSARMRETMSNKFEHLSDNDWGAVRAALATREEQQQERLVRHRNHPISDRAEDTLMRILQGP